MSTTDWTFRQIPIDNVHAKIQSLWLKTKFHLNTNEPIDQNCTHCAIDFILFVEHVRRRWHCGSLENKSKVNLNRLVWESVVQNFVPGFEWISYVFASNDAGTYFGVEKSLENISNICRNLSNLSFTSSIVSSDTCSKLRGIEWSFEFSWKAMVVIGWIVLIQPSMAGRGQSGSWAGQHR